MVAGYANGTIRGVIRLPTGAELPADARFRAQNCCIVLRVCDRLCSSRGLNVGCCSDQEETTMAAKKKKKAAKKSSKKKAAKKSTKKGSKKKAGKKRKKK